jgi:hypothetical protein
MARSVVCAWHDACAGGRAISADSLAASAYMGRSLKAKFEALPSELSALVVEFERADAARCGRVAASAVRAFSFADSHLSRVFARAEKASQQDEDEEGQDSVSDKIDGFRDMWWPRRAKASKKKTKHAADRPNASLSGTDSELESDAEPMLRMTDIARFYFWHGEDRPDSAAPHIVSLLAFFDKVPVAFVLFFWLFSIDYCHSFSIPRSASIPFVCAARCRTSPARCRSRAAILKAICGGRQASRFIGV